LAAQAAHLEVARGTPVEKHWFRETLLQKYYNLILHSMPRIVAIVSACASAIARVGGPCMGPCIRLLSVFTPVQTGSKDCALFFYFYM